MNRSDRVSFFLSFVPFFKLVQVADLQQSNEMSLLAVKKASDALADSHESYQQLCSRIRDAEAQRITLEDTLLDRRVQLQALQTDVGNIESECRRDEDALRDFELKDAAASVGSVQVLTLLLFLIFRRSVYH